MDNIEKIPHTFILDELRLFAEEHSKKLFRDKVIRVFTKCLKTNRLKLATKIADKYYHHLTQPLQCDMVIAQAYSAFIARLMKHKSTSHE